MTPGTPHTNPALLPPAKHRETFATVPGQSAIAAPAEFYFASFTTTTTIAHRAASGASAPTTMSAIPSLNNSITAAWSVTPVPSSSSTPQPQPQSQVGPALKKRTKRTIGLNSTAGSEPATPDAGTPVDERPPTPPRRKRIKPDPLAQAANKYAPPDLDLESLGGVSAQKAALQEAVVLPLLYPEVFAFSGHNRPCGVLLHGVPGGGKTHLVRCLAGVRIASQYRLQERLETDNSPSNSPSSAYPLQAWSAACQENQRRH